MPTATLLAMTEHEDEAYARELFAILSNPNPTGIDPDDPYGQADDGIDRYDGFGRDVWVKSVTVADGEHGSQLVVELQLAPSAELDMVEEESCGPLRLPLDAEWRELSGYADPASYAPVVARAAWSAAGRHLERRLQRPPNSRRQGGQCSGLDSHAQWQILLDALGVEGLVRQVEPGRIQVQRAEGRAIMVVVSPDQWQRVLADHVGDDVDLYFADLLGPRQDDETFLVFYEGDLCRSTREKLPPVRSRALERRLDRARTEHGAGQLGWRA